jgi:HlyD family secretion protein
MSWASRHPGLTIGFSALLIAGAITGLRLRGPAVLTSVASRTDLEQHVIASGRVRVVTRVQVSAQAPGRVVAVAAIEGQRVQVGDLLVQLDDDEARAAVAQARAAVRQASGRVDQLRDVGAVVSTEAARQAATTLAHAESELARIERLAEAGVATLVDVDAARRDVEIARARKNAAEAQQVAATPRGIETAIAASALGESQARLAAALARLEQMRLVAPHDGLVLARTVEPGDTVQPGSPLFEIAADGDTELAIEPDERNLAWIRVGQPARASADAFPQHVFDAEVSYIAPAIDPRRGTVEVRLRVSEPPGFLKADMTVSVDLTVAARRQVIAVPTDAIRRTSFGEPWVAVIEGGRVSRRTVTLGIRGQGHSEIASGLDEGMVVVTSTDVVLADGQRVRAIGGGA